MKGLGLYPLESEYFLNKSMLSLDSHIILFLSYTRLLSFKEQCYSSCDATIQINAEANCLPSIWSSWSILFFFPKDNTFHFSTVGATDVMISKKDNLGWYRREATEEFDRYKWPKSASILLSFRPSSCWGIYNHKMIPTTKIENKQNQVCYIAHKMQ